MSRPRRIASVIVLILLALVVAMGLRIFTHPPVARTVRPRGIMGTETAITVVFPYRRAYEMEDAHRSADAALRQVEARVSRWIASSDIGRLNRAEVGVLVEMSPETVELLRDAKEFTQQTEGAFDPTVGPLIALWTEAGEHGRPPGEDEIAETKALTGWRHFELLDNGAKRLTEGAWIDLGGIAKGYGIDEAIEAIRAEEAVGGLVDVGGDIRCFGRRAEEGGPWRVSVRNPFNKNPGMLLLAVDEGAVCTSGNYERYGEIEGARYSHIIDPRTGRPTEALPSVTVIAPTALVADVWATALSVLGPGGFDLIGPDADIEAMCVVGSPDDWRMRATEGFADYVRDVEAIGQPTGETP